MLSNGDLRRSARGAVQTASSADPGTDVDLAFLASLPKPMTPHQQRRRAKLLADSPENVPRFSAVADAIENVSNADAGECGCDGSSLSDEEEACSSASAAPSTCACCSGCGAGCRRGLRTAFAGLSRSTVWKAIALGQVVSLLICSAAVICQVLVENYSVRLPAGQLLTHYLLLCSVYFSLLCFRRAKCMSGSSGAAADPVSVVFRRRGLRYFFLAVVDVQANYLTGRALQYTTLTSVQLLDCLSLPTVLILSWLVLKARYRLTHIGGMAMALMAVVVIVWSDVDDGKGGVTAGGKNRLIGDMLTLGGSVLSGVSLVGLEHAVRVHDAAEFLGMVGLFGSIITIAQISLLERGDLLNVRWDQWEICVLVMALALTHFARVSCLPFVLRLASSACVGLSSLAADFYSIVAGVIFLHFKFRTMYLLSLALVMVGLVVFSVQPVPFDTKSRKGSSASLSASSCSRKHSSSSGCVRGHPGHHGQHGQHGPHPGGRRRHASSTCSLEASSVRSSETTVFAGSASLSLSPSASSSFGHARHIPQPRINMYGVGATATKLPTIEIHSTPSMYSNGCPPQSVKVMDLSLDAR